MTKIRKTFTLVKLKDLNCFKRLLKRHNIPIETKTMMVVKSTGGYVYYVWTNKIITLMSRSNPFTRLYTNAIGEQREDCGVGELHGLEIIGKESAIKPVLECIEHWSEKVIQH